jgi:poly(3-hydroxybutyrate) depolymerase
MRCSWIPWFLIKALPFFSTVLIRHDHSSFTRVKRILIAASVLLLAAIVVVVVIVVWQRPIAADVFPNEEIAVDGATRDYRLVVPHKLFKPAPIVFAFHGLGDSTEAMARASRLDQLAADNGFVLVYPAARKSMWSTVDAKADNLDANADVQFFDQLLKRLCDQYNIDRDRVYGMGMSNGAAFVQLLAIARPHDLAAIVAHSGIQPGSFGSSANWPPILRVVGENDAVLREMQSATGQDRTDGRLVEFISVPGLGHSWSPRHNAAMWDFLARTFKKSRFDREFMDPGADKNVR